jgi:hypothetical protein
MDPVPPMKVWGTAQLDDAPVRRPAPQTIAVSSRRVPPSAVDPFLGSGTAMVAAERTWTSCFAIEIDPIHVEVALARCGSPRRKREPHYELIVPA